MQVLTVNGCGPHHAVTGDPDGAPVVFANSLGTDFRVWDRLLPLLPPGCACCATTCAGTG